MKKSRHVLFLICIIIFLISTAACSSDPVDNSTMNPSDTASTTETEESPTEDAESHEDSQNQSETFMQLEYVTFEEAVQLSNAAILGEYVEMVEYESYVEYKFRVLECLYGDVTEEEIYLNSELGTGTVSGIQYSYELGADVYTEGFDYILIMEKLESIMYDHDRYLLLTDLYLCEDEQEYLMYSQPIAIPDETSAKDYILSIRAAAQGIESEPASEDGTTTAAYENELDEMAGESQYIGIVEIIALENESTKNNGNAYRCLVESLIKGGSLNTYDDGTILISILKDTVEVGGRYIIGFSPVSGEDTLVCIQETKTSVYDVSDELISDITQLLTE